jgi:hypothetical protein
VRQLLGQGHDDAAGKLAVPLFFRFLHRIPERSSERKLRRRTLREQEFSVNDAGLMRIVLPALVILGIEPGAAEISRGSDGGASIAALDDCDVEMGTRDRVSPPIWIEKSRLLCSGRVGMFACCGHPSKAGIWYSYTFFTGCLITVFHFSGATFLASDKYIS